MEGSRCRQLRRRGQAFLIALSHLPGATGVDCQPAKIGDAVVHLFARARIHRCGAFIAPCRGMRTSSAMGRRSQTPCAPRATKHPLRVCFAPRPEISPPKGATAEFLSYPRQYHQAQRGRSAVAAAAYRKRNQTDSEWTA